MIGASAPVHQSVLAKEVVESLRLEPGDVIVDATVGGGGHAAEILRRIVPGGKLIGIDADPHALEIAARMLRDFGNEVILRHANFRCLDSVLKDVKVSAISGIVFDLGVSSYQLEDASRGFGIKTDSRLDMRMDPHNRMSAFDVVNRAGEKDLADILYRYGEERFSRRIARAVVYARARKPIDTTKELARIVARSIPGRCRPRAIHPATRTFQALRIYVNDELGALEEGLGKAIEHLEGGARISVISFHSLEDRIVKQAFKGFSNDKLMTIVTKKPITPRDEEISSNPRARSAKLRVAERIRNG